MRTNKAVVARPFPTPKFTHEGAVAYNTSAEQALRRSVMACLLWEDSFYESGEEIATRISDLVKQVAPEKVAAIALEARTAMKLRHVPLLLAVKMAGLKTHARLLPELSPQLFSVPTNWRKCCRSTPRTDQVTRS